MDNVQEFNNYKNMANIRNLYLALPVTKEKVGQGVWNFLCRCITHIRIYELHADKVN